MPLGARPSRPARVVAGARLSRPARVVVVGSSGSGKTTFAAALAARLSVSHVELDALYWGPRWTPRGPAEFEAAVGSAIAGAEWVADGNHAEVRERVWRRATALVWLDHSFPRVYARALRRSFRRVATREELFSGNRETLRTLLDPQGTPIWVLRSFWRRRRELRSLLREDRFAHLDRHHFRHPTEAQAFLDSHAP